MLWIVTTQWRAQATGYGGDPNARTPYLDALAARSVNYLQAVTPHPFGPFARAALLTGVPSPQNGVRDYFDPLPEDSHTIAHALADRGYHTAFFGKWHLAERNRRAPLVGEAHARTLVPVSRRGGFQDWEGFESGFLLNDPWLHGSQDHPLPVQVRGYQSEILVDRLLNWQAKRKQLEDIPWFAMLSLEAPHPPYDAPANGVRPRSPDSIVLRANVRRGGAEEVQARRELAGYYAHIEATDAAIGRLLTALPESLLVVFTSVHGDMHGSHGLFRKGWPYEESVRVPLLVRGAPSAQGGVTECSDPVSLVDLFAMTLAWSDGVPWRCEREDALISMPSIVQLPHQCDRVWEGRRSATRKVVTTAQGEAWMGFDLVEDPFEQRNLALPAG